MALNIPVNLMNTAAPPAQTTTVQPNAVQTNGSSAVVAVQPASASSNSRGTANDGGGMHRNSAEQQALMFKARTTQAPAKAPDRAAPNSIVTAQTRSAAQEPSGRAEKAISAPEPAPAHTTPRQSELDRYAPPNPLPTAPILQLAASYAAMTKQKV